jgi:hypothetical protein
LFGIEHNVKLPDKGNPGVSFHARTFDLSEEIVRKIEGLIWKSEIRDQNGEFLHHTSNLNLKELVALWDDLGEIASG